MVSPKEQLTNCTQIHLDRICKSIGKDATTSQTGLLYSVGPTGKQMHQLHNPIKRIKSKLKGGRVENNLDSMQNDAYKVHGWGVHKGS